LQHKIIDILWVDLSVRSRRLHSFFSVPGENWVVLNVPFDNVESICITSGYPENDGTTLRHETQLGQTLNSQANKTGENSCFICIHMKLNVDLKTLARELEELSGPEFQSLFLGFEDISAAYAAFEKMKYPIHTVGF